MSLGSNPKVVSFLRGKPKASEQTIALVAELKLLAVQCLGERLNLMFDGADDLLFEFAERASNNSDRRLFFDTMRTVRLGRKNLLAQFTAGIEESFSPVQGGTLARPETPAPEPAADEIELQSTEALELDIAVSNMVTKAEALYKQLAWDLNGRLQALIEEQGAPIAPDALSPASICRAFRQSAKSLSVEFAVELVVFKLFDRLVLGELGDLYGRALQFLKGNGLRAPQFKLSPNSSGGGLDGVRPSFSNTSLFSSNPMPMPSPEPPQAGLAASMMMSPSLDQQTLSSLQRLQASEPGGLGAGAPAAPGYGNAQLAADLAAAAQGQAILGWGARQTTAYMQRASLVGHMFNDILADPYLPGTIRAQFDALRLSTIKVALKDLAFVSDPDHPVRGLINELASMATSARAASSQESMARIAELVSEIQAQFDIAAETLRKPGTDIELIDPEQAERFIEQQAAQTAARRQSMVKKVRKVIAEELQLRTRGRVIRDELKPLLQSAWAPMMAVHLLQSGPESEAWLEGMRLLDRVLRAIDPDRAEARSDEQLATLVADLRSAFEAGKLGEERIGSALAGLGTVVAALGVADAPATVEPAAAPVNSPAPLNVLDNGETDLLEMLLQPGAWFLVHDHDRGQPRWMKAVAYYAGLDCGTFAEFNGGNTLIIKSRVLLEDLAAGRTVPVDLGPTAKEAFERFRARSA